MNASDKLGQKNQEGKFICVGLDTDINKLPVSLKNKDDAVYEFNRRIIEKTSSSAAAYKLNFAFYETSGPAGVDTLKRTIETIPDDILIIGDAKRGDIGNTAKMYADSVFNYFGCDASTLNPYMGEDSLQPYPMDDDEEDLRRVPRPRTPTCVHAGQSPRRSSQRRDAP